MRLNLATHWERVKTEPGLKKNVIALAALLVTAVLAGGWILGNQQFTPPWSDDVIVAAAFEATPGISPGNGQEVRVSGIKVGDIIEADVNDKGKAVLQLSIDKDIEVYDDATLVLRPKSPLNEMYVTIDPGGETPGAKQVKTGHDFPVASSRRPVQVDEVLGSLDNDARAALTSVLVEADVALASAPKNLTPGLEGTSDVVVDLKPVVSELDKRRESLRKLIAAFSDISRAVGEDDKRMIALANDMQTTLAAVADESDALGRTIDELPGVVKNLKSSTAAVSKMTKLLNPTLRDVQQASDRLPGALNKFTDTAQELDKTLQYAKPVIKKGKPVVADLRPFTAQMRTGLPTLEQSTQRLDPVTASVVDYLPDLGAFAVNTRSIVSLRDDDGGILRGQLTMTPTSVPLGLAGLIEDKPQTKAEAQQ